MFYCPYFCAAHIIRIGGRILGTFGQNGAVSRTRSTISLACLMTFLPVLVTSLSALMLEVFLDFLATVVVFPLIYFLPHYGPGVDSDSNRNEYQEYFLGAKAAGV
jgi:hypothetical protein